MLSVVSFSAVIWSRHTTPSLPHLRASTLPRKYYFTERSQATINCNLRSLNKEKRIIFQRGFLIQLLLKLTFPPVSEMRDKTQVFCLFTFLSLCGFIFFPLIWLRMPQHPTESFYMISNDPLHVLETIALMLQCACRL